MKTLKIVLILQFMLIATIGCSQHTKMNTKHTTMVKKGKIKGKIINLPDREKLESIEISLSPDLYFSQTLDSLGSFISKEMVYGTYTLKIFHQESHYPILIKNFQLNAEIVDLGELPLFKDSFGYFTEWGVLADGISPYHHRYPMYPMDTLEITYQDLFAKQFSDKELEFKTIDVDIDSTDNIVYSWRFAILKKRNSSKK